MKKAAQAVDLYQQNYTCSQAVFVPFCEGGSLSREDALRLSTALGGGVCGTGTGLCGAAGGALLALSLKYGMDDSTLIEKKAQTYQLGQTFLSRFTAKMGCNTCEGILGVNISTPEYKADKARAKELRDTVCTHAVKTAAELLEELTETGR